MGARIIMASAAQREVGEKGEIELLTWGMRYAQREKKRESLHYCSQDKSNSLGGPDILYLSDYQACNRYFQVGLTE